MSNYTVEEAGRKGGKASWGQDSALREAHAKKIGDSAKIIWERRRGQKLGKEGHSEENNGEGEDKMVRSEKGKSKINIEK